MVMSNMRLDLNKEASNRINQKGLFFLSYALSRCTIRFIIQKTGSTGLDLLKTLTEEAQHDKGNLSGGARQVFSFFVSVC